MMPQTIRRQDTIGLEQYPIEILEDICYDTSWPSKANMKTTRGSHSPRIIFFFLALFMISASKFIISIQSIESRLASEIIVPPEVTEQDQKVYILRAGSPPPKFLDQVNLKDDMEPAGYLSLDQTHSQGRFHTNVMLYVTDASGRNILMLKRSPTLFTCPNAWTIVGEHTSGVSRNDLHMA
jgi:hypothetical protein